MRRGFSLIEALIVAALLAALGIPLLGLISTGTHEGALSEDFMFAEVLASRFLEEWASLPFTQLDDLVPRKMTTSGGSPLAVPPSEPHRETLKAPAGFHSELELTRVREGLLGLEVTVTWQVPQERAGRKFTLYLLKHNPNLALEAPWKF